MASPLLSKVPQCTSCVRRITSWGNTLSSPGGQQIRGKKRLAKVATVNVQLLRNLPGYGKKGQILPITPGVMRNIWYPKKIAGYVTVAKLESLGKKDVAFERDPTFGSRKERKSIKGARTSQLAKAKKDVSNQADVLAKDATPAAPTPIEVELLSPEQATKLLSKLLPPSIDFYRTPIVIAPPPPKRFSPSIPAESALSIAAASAAAERTAKETNAQMPEKTSIYGSVSTSDIAANLKAILAEDIEGRRIVFSPEDISFVDKTEDKVKVKHLGSFEVEIRLADASDVVRRKINVNAQN